MSPASFARLCCWEPGGRPWLAYAAGTRADRLRALDLFPRGTFKRRMFHAGIRVLTMVGLDSAMGTWRDSAGELLSREELASLLKSLSAGAGDACDWLLTWPTRPERKRMYLIFHSRKCSISSVVKIGAGSFNERQLRNEATALRQLASESHPFSIPSVLFERELEGGRRALALGGFTAHLKPLSASRVSVAGLEVANHLLHRPVAQPRISLATVPWFELFWGKAPDGAAAQRFLAMRDAEIEIAFAHGDLGPGNMLDDGSAGVFLFDWENASPQAPILTDELGFWLACRQRAALRKPRVLAAQARTRFAGSPEIDLLAALGFLCAHDNLAATCLLEAWP